ncbi:MAG: 2-C-methyl-D-erythritol 4-phosphate cytidylyltransferase [Bdellovibrio sp.]|nr:2-C-methyl-D-erythritol 4-phosphate cytidylyltransferase [Methylotenera sp.]
MAFFHIIIPAAGNGSRMAGDIPKQYMLLYGKPLISHCIETFFNHPRIASIHVALHPKDIFWRDLTPEPASKLKLHYTGGDTRTQTVLNTLLAIDVANDDWILVHDAARPGLTQYLLDDLLDALENDPVGGLLALPVADTLKFAGEQSQVLKTIPRTHLWQAQTPQMFRYGVLRHALQANSHAASSPATDEAEAIEAQGLQPKLVLGSMRNLKVTYPQDLHFLESIFDYYQNRGQA